MLTPQLVFLCPGCGETFQTQIEWDKHAEKSADAQKIVADWRKEAEAFVGRTIALTVQSRYPQTQGCSTDIGVKHVTVIGIEPEGPVCIDSMEPPDLIIDSELLDVGGDRDWGYKLFATNKISPYALQSGEWGPTGKDTSYLDAPLKAWMDSGLPASEFLKLRR
jgi:hypothetical protein